MTVEETVKDLARIVANSLENQHDWTQVQVHAAATAQLPLIISGLPPHRLYIHPDEQIEIIKAERNREDHLPQPPELEWVLPTHLNEKWSVSRFAAVFDALEVVPPGKAATCSDCDSDQVNAHLQLWRGPKRGKRVVLATVQDDSTVVYYLVHDGIVKPRQN